MAIGRTARGTKTGTSPSGSITMSGVTVGVTGSTLVVVLGFIDGGNGAEDGVTWNGVSMTPVSGVAGSTSVSAYYLPNATAGTGSVVVDLTTAGTWASYAMFATEVTGAAAASFDKSHAGSGTSTSPSSGATATLAQANELCVGAVAWQNTAISGAWSNSFSAGQSGTAGAGASAIALEEGTLTVASTAAVTAAKTTAANKGWAALVMTFKEGASNVNVNATRIVAAAAVNAVLLSLGPIAAGCIRANGSPDARSVAIVAGPATAAAERATAAAAAHPVTADPGPYDSVAVPALATIVDDSGGPMTLRCSTSPYNDETLDTYGTRPAVFGSGSGTLIFDLYSMANSAIAGSGAISGVVFYAYARRVVDAPVAITSGRIHLGSGIDVPFTSQPPSGPFGGAPDFAVIQTSLQTTHDGVHAWDWANLYAALTGLSARWTYSNASPLSAFGQVDLAEVWCEVRGPIGTLPDPIIIKSPVDSVRLGPLATPPGVKGL